MEPAFDLTLGKLEQPIVFGDMNKREVLKRDDSKTVDEIYNQKGYPSIR